MDDDQHNCSTTSHLDSEVVQEATNMWQAPKRVTAEQSPITVDHGAGKEVHLLLKMVNRLRPYIPPSPNNRLLRVAV
ncbi:unnamed protein product [Gongylonema pulchrum]|uniref:Uncharacterized protein n=1 Tax=Gongylonema pulchrum TaxID=637853 RepID=A0A183EYH1_9BILA|nr:unnamed protein product [Gongylonema pulchrum]